MMKTKSNKLKGFTLIETLVAISILVLAVTGAFSAAQSGLTSAMFSKDQIIAFYLAQEGVEQIRNLRDTNGLKGVGWMNGISNGGDPCFLGTTCMVDALDTASPLKTCPTGCPNLKLNAAGFYSYDTGADTKFRRDVMLTQVGTNEIQISVSVYWSKGLIPGYFNASEIIFNWQ